jgi:diacylglycerol kinase family enzyme
MKAVVVHNQRSGSALGVDELKRQFKAAGIDVVKTFPVTRNIRQHLKPYLNNSSIVVAAYGGDGTISRVAGALAGTGTVFAPLPGGTLNHFTKDLGIAQDFNEALSALPKSKPKKVDVARVNDRIVINNTSIGLYPSALQMRDEMDRKFIGKWIAAIIASFKALWRYNPYTVTIKNETFRTPFIFVGNNDYKLERRLIGRRTSLDEGVLSIYAVKSTGRFGLFILFVRALFHKLESSDEVKIWKTKEITVHTGRARVRISRDGEHEKMETPLHYEVLPGALIVIGSS